MGINFGWSYPPGCSSTPADEPSGPCEVCGQDVDSDHCACPECPECGDVGRLSCYGQHPDGHGLVRSDEQIRLRAEAEAAWEAERKAEANYLASLPDGWMEPW